MAASAGLNGPHSLSFDGINTVLAVRSPGTFALGYVGRDNAFYINYVGRSDEDIGQRLQDLIGSDASFKFSLANSAQEAFWRECELFHMFRPPANRVHPGRPHNTNWVCPRCNLLESWRR